MDAKEINRRVVEQFRAGGDIPGMHRDRLLLLTTTGRSSGKSRTTPMMFHRDGDHLYVVASDNGAKKDPSWYRNLMKDASVGVEVGDEKYDAVASTVEGDERATAWASITAANPFFLEHQAGVEREIPLVGLNRVS
jgi:deazaflavin-dependent oxidoreductase (nitroreductase family)